MSYFQSNVKPSFTVVDQVARQKVNHANIQILKEIANGNFNNAQNFTGFGGLRKLFTPSAVDELGDFLSQEEIQSLIKSTSSGYYTPKLLIHFMYAYTQLKSKYRILAFENYR